MAARRAHREAGGMLDLSLFPEVFSIDIQNDRITYISPNLVERLGRDRIDSPGEVEVSRVLLMEDWLAIIRSESLLPNRSRFFDVRLRHYNGGELLAHILVSRYGGGEGLSYRLIGIFSDGGSITSAISQLDTRESTLAEYTAILSHEIRTPINSLIGLIELLEATPLNDEQRPLVRTMSVLSSSLLMLLNDAIDTTRIQSGKMVLRYEEFDLRPILKRIVSRYQLLYPHLNLSCRYSDSLPEKLWGDSHKIEQLLTNVFTNSLKYTPSGEVSLDVVPSEQPRELLFTIRDTGIGIAKAYQEDLFSPFAQVKGRELRSSSGLGLYIARSIAELHGGRVELKSEEQRGTVITFILPLLREKSGTSPNSEMGMLGNDKMGDGLFASVGDFSPDESSHAHEHAFTRRILLVDDNEVNVMVVNKFLTRWGYESDCVYSGIDALAAIDRQEYGLVLVDIRMPGMDGITVAQKIRERNDLRSKTPIVALTASTESGIKERIRDAKMNGYIFKPFNAADLLQIIEKYLGKNG